MGKVIFEKSEHIKPMPEPMYIKGKPFFTRCLSCNSISELTFEDLWLEKIPRSDGCFGPKFFCKARLCKKEVFLDIFSYQYNPETKELIADYIDQNGKIRFRSFQYYIEDFNKDLINYKLYLKEEIERLNINLRILKREFLKRKEHAEEIEKIKIEIFSLRRKLEKRENDYNR